MIQVKNDRTVTDEVRDEKYKTQFDRTRLIETSEDEKILNDIKLYQTKQG